MAVGKINIGGSIPKLKEADKYVLSRINYMAFSNNRNIMGNVPKNNNNDMLIINDPMDGVLIVAYNGETFAANFSSTAPIQLGKITTKSIAQVKDLQLIYINGKAYAVCLLTTIENGITTYRVFIKDITTSYRNEWREIHSSTTPTFLVVSALNMDCLYACTVDANKAINFYAYDEVTLNNISVVSITYTGNFGTGVGARIQKVRNTVYLQLADGIYMADLPSRTISKKYGRQLTKFILLEDCIHAIVDNMYVLFTLNLIEMYTYKFYNVDVTDDLDNIFLTPFGDIVYTGTDTRTLRVLSGYVSIVDGTTWIARTSYSSSDYTARHVNMSLFTTPSGTVYFKTNSSPWLWYATYKKELSVKSIDIYTLNDFKIANKGIVKAGKIIRNADGELTAITERPKYLVLIK